MTTIKDAEAAMFSLFRQQEQRMIDAGFPDAVIYGNFGACKEDDGKRSKVWCNVYPHGPSSPGYGYSGRHNCSLTTLPDTVTAMIAERPLEMKRAKMAVKTGLAIGYLESIAQLDALDTTLKKLLSADVYKLLSRK